MIQRLLIANRGEIAVRVARTAAVLGIDTVAVHATDDAGALHCDVAGRAIALPGAGPTAYLDPAALVAAAVEAGCDAVHPGYGFLSEDATFAQAVEAAGLSFVGPRPETLALLGDKLSARRLAASLDVPVPAGRDVPVSLAEAKAFFATLAPGDGVMVKSVSGGGGRGIRPALTPAELPAAFDAAMGEARMGTDAPQVFVERRIVDARHIEVQVIGDGRGDACHLWDRDCSLQRQNQKIIEVAPAMGLAPKLRDDMLAAAVRIARAVRLRGLATIEFLVEDSADRFNFLEVNPRIQVEHTVTEAVTGLDLVALQLRVADGAALADLGVMAVAEHAPTTSAVQLRINAETLGTDGRVFPAVGQLARFDLPGGPGVRIDAGARMGDRIGGQYDPLLAKIIVWAGSDDIWRRVGLGLDSVRVDGVATNVELLRAVLDSAGFVPGAMTTGFVADVIAARTDLTTQIAAGEGITSPLAGLVRSVAVSPGDVVAAGQEVALIEAMKMEYPVLAVAAGKVRAVYASAGDTVAAGASLIGVDESEGGPQVAVTEDAGPVAALDALTERLAFLDDAARPDAVAKRHGLGKRTARENIAELCDAGSFVEFGGLTIAAQRTRRPEDELIRRTPGDGMVAGIATVGGRDCLVFSYDAMVMAGTQALMNHKKLSRLLDVGRRRALPVIGYVEGGGGRPGDVDDATRATGLDMLTFARFAALNTPRISIASGRCFAGNAVLAGASDVTIATQDVSLGMAGPAMIEGAGLGVVAAEAIGPSAAQWANGVLDILVADEAAATTVARGVMGMLAGTHTADWTAPDATALRRAIPADRRRAYDVTRVVEGIADGGSAITLGGGYAPAMVTALARIEGRAVGIIANNPAHDAGAIDADGSVKAGRFLALCDRFGLPVVSLCDTPGFAVGAEVERTGLVRKAGDFFSVAAKLSVPLVAIVLRRAYGLGAMAMTGGSFHTPRYMASWPSGEFGGMGPEGAVRLGYRAELADAPDEVARQALFDRLLAEVYDRGRAERVAMALELDAVIDPADTRARIVAAFGGDQADVWKTL